MKRLLVVPLLVAAALVLFAGSAVANTFSINAANAPTGTHFAGKTSATAETCQVNGTTVTCSSYQLAGVGNANATANLTANYTAIVDCFNHGTNKNNPIESHTTSFDQDSTTGQLEPKNGKLNVPQVRVTPTSGEPPVTSCPNPNWTPRIRPGSFQLTSFTYTLTFAGFNGPFITITGP